MAPILRRDAGLLLARALIADAARHGLGITIDDWRSHPWASATFTGARHAATLAVTGDPATWLAALPDADLPLRGHLVADIVARADAGIVTVEALTLTDDRAAPKPF